MNCTIWTASKQKINANLQSYRVLTYVLILTVYFSKMQTFAFCRLTFKIKILFLLLESSFYEEEHLRHFQSFAAVAVKSNLISAWKWIIVPSGIFRENGFLLTRWFILVCRKLYNGDVLKQMQYTHWTSLLCKLLMKLRWFIM